MSDSDAVSTIEFQRIFDGMGRTELERMAREWLDNLTNTQARCTELLLENRALKKGRDERQARVGQWVRETFGEAVFNRTERVARLVEEVAEMAQAEEFPREQIVAVVDHVYAKAPGDARQEVGGVGVTLLAYCESVDISADEAESAEVERVVSLDAAYVRERQNRKAAAGVAQRVEVERAE
jgi:hypothetical protein